MPPITETAPPLRLPADTRPRAEAIELHIDPKQERFSGKVDIDVALEHARTVVWLHGGADLHVTAASVTPAGGAPIVAAWRAQGTSGIAGIALAHAAPQGDVRVHIEYDAPLARGQEGLYRTSEAGVEYAFTQFESVAARHAFPCFDEPGFKIPFTTTLVVPSDLSAVANTEEVTRSSEGTRVRIKFAPTTPLPSYLVAFAVGAFDVVPAPDVPPNAVRKRPLHVRAIVPHGRAKDVAYALSHTGEILSTLEQYFGIEYPFSKIDILAVPGKGGAMENAGAITFGERLVLMDEATAPISQRRLYANVMAHELAHQWTGDLVTLAWWDDAWLNEAFATWVGTKAVDLWEPKLHMDLSLLRQIHGAMNADSLVSARAIRQPIESANDIENAFDSITYNKGAGVLAMFEAWAGPEAWQKGLHAYLEAHRFGNATADDFLDAESTATGKDVKTAFHTFLDRPGLPLVTAAVTCPANGTKPPMLHLKQSRFLPLGSTGSTGQSWQVPVCTRTDRDVFCTLLTQPEADVPLGTTGGGGACPAWVLPNADAKGYYQLSVAPPLLAKLRKNLAALSTREQIAYAASLHGDFARATAPFKDILEAVSPLANATDPGLAEEAMRYVGLARDWLYEDTALRGNVEAYGRTVYAPAASKLGWDRKEGEDDDARLRRASVLGFLISTARDGAVRAQAKKRGQAYLDKLGGPNAAEAAAMDPDTAGLALSVVGEEADRTTRNGIRALLFASVDETVRARLLYALSVADHRELAALALVLDTQLRDNEAIVPLRIQLSRVETRDDAWAWLKAHFDTVQRRLPKHHGGVALLGAPSSFCDDAHAADVEEFLKPKAAAIEGGARVLASTVESIRLCAAGRKAFEPAAKTFFAKRR